MKTAAILLLVFLFCDAITGKDFFQNTFQCAAGFTDSITFCGDLTIEKISRKDVQCCWNLNICLGVVLLLFIILLAFGMWAMICWTCSSFYGIMSTWIRQAFRDTTPADHTPSDRQTTIPNEYTTKFSTEFNA